MAEDWRIDREKALLALQREKPEERLAAAEALVQIAKSRSDRSEFIEVLPKLLADPYDRVRRVGVGLAGMCLEEEEAAELFAKQLADKSPDVRIEAAGQLADLARPDSRGALAAALNDDNLSVRFEAARGMAALHHSSGLEVLTEALEDDLLRFRALGALAELGDAQALPAIRKVFRKFFLSAFERTQAAGAMAKLGDPEGGKHLLERTRRKWSTDRALAIELLGELKIPGALERLLQIVRDRKDTARGAAARGLGRLGDRTALDALLSVFEERQAPEDVRLDAAEGLVLLKDPQARARVEQGASQFESEEAREEVRAMLEEQS
ncbi:MAG: HEAT repeat domain-containing protein [Myxococcaceae bacterium]